MANLTLAVDLYGCPNRCRHCWLGHMPNRAMEDGADERIVAAFQPHFDSIAFYSWVREPDFCQDYRERWERDKALSVNAQPVRFELASFWRLARDEQYAPFLRDVGVRCVQLTFFGMEETTDRYIGRKGAFRELLRATDILLENGIAPRWQAFINEENRFEIVRLQEYARSMRLEERCRAAGGQFRFFTHEGSCDGENRRLYDIRIRKEHIPGELISVYHGYDSLLSEEECCALLANESEPFVYHNEGDIVLYIANDYGVYFNFTHMTPEWRVGDLRTDPPAELARRVLEEDTPALRLARQMPLRDLARRYGDPTSRRAFGLGDYKEYLLNRFLEERARS